MSITTHKFLEIFILINLLLDTKDIYTYIHNYKLLIIHFFEITCLKLGISTLTDFLSCDLMATIRQLLN